MGDVALSLPFIYEAAKEYPQTSFCVVTTPLHAQLLTPLLPNIKVIPYDIRQQGSVWGAIRMAFSLHKQWREADVIDLHDVLRTRLIRALLSALGHRIYTLKKPRRQRQRLLQRQPTAVIAPSNYVTPMTQVYSRTFQLAGLTKVQQGWSPWLQQPKQQSLVIGVAPYAKHKAKVLPTQHLKKLLHLLHEAFPNYQIRLYGGGASERHANAALAKEAPQYLTCSNAPSLAKELEEIAQLAVMLSMDSANQHLAAWVGTPVVSIWGATHPAAGFLPWNGELQNCIGMDLPCRPCSVYGQKPCLRGDYLCLNNLNLTLIIQAVKKLLPHHS